MPAISLFHHILHSNKWNSFIDTKNVWSRTLILILNTYLPFARGCLKELLVNLVSPMFSLTWHLLTWTFQLARGCLQQFQLIIQIPSLGQYPLWMLIERMLGILSWQAEIQNSFLHRCHLTSWRSVYDFY